jgi:hypothetical protein
VSFEISIPTIFSHTSNGYQGGLCGGIFLDEQFLRGVADKLGRKSCVPQELALNRAFMEREWESGAKSAFRNEPGAPWLVEVPTTSAGGKRPRALQFSQWVEKYADGISLS